MVLFSAKFNIDKRGKLNENKNILIHFERKYI